MAAKQINSSGEIIKEMQFARNDLRVLALIRDCGFIRANQLSELLRFRGFRSAVHLKHVYGYAKRLVNMGLVEHNRRVLGGNLGAFSVTKDGHDMLRECSFGLCTDDVKTNSDPHADAAGIQHFISMNDVMLKFHQAYPVSFWLTDFLVRFENQLRESEGFGKDFDAVFEIALDGKPLTMAIEYEHTRRNRTRHREAFKSYTADPYIQLVIMIFDSARWIAPFNEALKVPGRRLCFTTSAEFFSLPFSSMRVFRWSGQTAETVTLLKAMQQATENNNQNYDVSYFPPK